jgi:uncharacterized membrane protein YidH (DUF202 family)
MLIKIITCFHLLVLDIIAGLFIAIVTMGIAMLSIWKYYMVIKDKQEFMKFMNEKENSQWGVVSTFMFIYFIHAHAHVFITLLCTCIQTLYIAFCIRTVI